MVLFSQSNRNTYMKRRKECAMSNAIDANEFYRVCVRECLCGTIHTCIAHMAGDAWSTHTGHHLRRETKTWFFSRLLISFTRHNAFKAFIFIFHFIFDSNRKHHSPQHPESLFCVYWIRLRVVASSLHYTNTCNKWRKRKKMCNLGTRTILDE